MSGSLNKSPKIVYLLSMVSLAFLLAWFLTGEQPPLDKIVIARKASNTMSESLRIISDYCSENNINMGNLEDDPGQSGLIGPPLSSITTTLGQLEAKRSSLNPDWAALLTRLLDEAGLQEGDRVALACSGSFPGFMIAALSATKAMDLQPVVILSLGSSSYGASNPEFTILHIYNLLKQNDIVSSPPAAVSLGGGNDTGQGFEGRIADTLRTIIEEEGLPRIDETSLEKSIRARESYYFRGGKETVKAFINSGGSWSSMGTSTLSLRIEPGRVSHLTLPPENERGEIFSMYEKGIPVIHLLNVNGLCRRYGIPWDSPRGTGKTRFGINHYYSGERRNMAIAGLTFFIVSMLLYNRLSRRGRRGIIK